MDKALAVADTAAAPTCPQCLAAMRPTGLEGHYGQYLTVDLCPPCRLAWFDEFESVRLSGLGWVTLLREMQIAPTGGPPPVAPTVDTQCPHCGERLQPVHNLNRFGTFAALECPKHHGHLQTFALLLAERGLVRPLNQRDLRVLVEEGRTPTCLNCGGAIHAGGSCSHCASPLVAIDMPRLFTALLMRHAEPLPEQAVQLMAWPCHGCGLPLSPNEASRCDGCLHPVVMPSVVDIGPVLDAVEPLLRAARPRGARPHGRKLRLMRGDHRNTALYRYARHLFGWLRIR